MRDEQDCPRSGTLDALAGEIDKVRRAVDDKASTEEVDGLARVVADLADTMAASRGSGGSEPAMSWLALPATGGTAAGLLADLVEWLGTVYLRYGDDAKGLPECWLWHPDIVEELCWLMSAWLAAYHGDDASVRAAADWHDRLRPGVVRRIGDYARACSLENHLPDRAPSGPTVPVVDAAEAIAAWWDQDRDERAPAPTDDQMIAAAAAARQARTGGGR